MVAGLVLPRLMPAALGYLPYQIVAYGIFLAIDGFPAVAPQKGICLDLRKRLGGLIVSLSGLTMYFFMFQHVMVSYFATHANVSSPEMFNSFNYFGFLVLSLLATFLIAMLADSIERRLRAMFGAQPSVASRKVV